MEISLTDFVDFTIVNGSTRVATVRRLKKRVEHDYDPKTDFWRTLRKGLVELHQTGRITPTELDSWLAVQTNVRRIPRYRDAVDGYKKFLGRRDLPWFDPPSAMWRERDLSVRVNPELGLIIDGKKTVIKLYFKNEEPTRARVQAVLAIMDIALAGKAGGAVHFAVLDVNKGHLLPPDGHWIKSDMEALLKADAGALIQLWNSI